MIFWTQQETSVCEIVDMFTRVGDMYKELCNYEISTGLMNTRMMRGADLMLFDCSLLGTSVACFVLLHHKTTFQLYGHRKSG